MKIAVMIISPMPILYRIFEALQDHHDVSVTVYYQKDIDWLRPGYDWRAGGSARLVKLQGIRQYREMLQHDYFLLHGIWYNVSHYLSFLVATLKGKKIANITESENEYTIRRYKIALKYLSARLLPKNNTYVLSLGGFEHCMADNLKYGFRRNNFFPFGYCGAVAEPANFRPKAYVPGQTVRLLYVGQLVHRKGIDILLEALAQVKNKAFKLHICGKGPEEEALRRLCQKLDLDERVTFAGHLDHDGLERAYREADVFVLPSRFDGWGAVLNEAAAHSLPLIASDKVRSHNQLIEEGKNGYVFENQQALTAILDRLTSNPGMLADMRKTSFDIGQQYAPKQLAARLHEYLRNM